MIKQTATILSTLALLLGLQGCSTPTNTTSANNSNDTLSSILNDLDSALNDQSQQTTDDNTGTDDTQTSTSGRLDTPTEWTMSEYPNYVRQVGTAVIDDDAKNLTPGTVINSTPDSLGRAGRAYAAITNDSADAGADRERDSMPDPAGWPSSNPKLSVVLKNGKSYRGYFWNRSHLIAKSLGGSETADNMVTGTRMQNVGANDGQGGMAYTETLARDWLDDNPTGTLWYEATPLYEGNELIPRSVVVDMLSSDGTLNMEIEVYNTANGYSIDYTTGTVTAE